MRSKLVCAFVALLLLSPPGQKKAFAYYDDVHYALTYYICRQNGYTPLQSYRIASVCSAVDWDPDTEPVQPMGQLKIVAHGAVPLIEPLSRVIYLSRDPEELLLDALKMDYSGLKPMVAHGQDPRWRFHAMRNELVYSDAIGRGSGAVEADAAILKQRDALIDFAIKTSKNPGAFLHAFQDEEPHRGYGTEWGHWPVPNDIASKHGGLSIGGTTDWIATRQEDVAMVSERIYDYLRRFMDKVSPHQRYRPYKEEDYRRLIPALARANPAPPPLDSDLKREMYVHYYAQENGINLRFLAGISDLAVVSDLASQLNRSGLSFKDLAKQKNGPKLEDAILVVNSALQEAGMDDRAPIGPASFNLGPDGNLADESQRDKWVLAGALEVTLQTPPAMSAPGQAPTYRTIVKMKPTRKGEQEYELHGLEPAMLKQGVPYRWQNLPIGDLIVEITKPDGTIVRREVTLEKQETILPVQLEPGASKVWICEKPKVRGGTVWGPYEEEGKFLPAFSGTATSASFTDPEGKHSGSAKWSALPESLREGQEVRITMSATKMRVSMNWPTGSKRSSYGVADLPELYPGRNSLDTSFKFQPGPGKAKFQVSVLAQPTYTAFSDAFGVYVTCEYRLAE